MAVAVDTSHEHTNGCAPGTAAMVSSLFDRHQQRVYRVCLSILRSHHDAEDALQQTFLNALRAIDGGVRPRAEGAWLVEIARNVCCERQRSAGRRTQRELLLPPDDLDHAGPAVTAGEDRAEELHRSLELLEPRQRTALLLREWRGLSHQEIGSVLDVSNGAAEALVFRARRSFARILDARGLRGVADVFGAVTALRRLVASGGAKSAAVVATCAVTAATAPMLEHRLSRLFAPEHPQRAQPTAVTGGAEAAGRTPGTAPSSRRVARVSARTGRKHAVSTPKTTPPDTVASPPQATVPGAPVAGSSAGSGAPPTRTATPVPSEASQPVGPPHAAVRTDLDVGVLALGASTSAVEVDADAHVGPSDTAVTASATAGSASAGVDVGVTDTGASAAADVGAGSVADASVSADDSGVSATVDTPVVDTSVGATLPLP
jgi:RNA polymerase sigma-70 factor (ECF subfamily)